MDIGNLIQWFFRILTAAFIYFAVHVLCNYLGMPVPKDLFIKIILAIIALIGGYFAFDD